MPLHANSIIALLRDLFRRAGLPNPECYSSHSLRRGFATWANASGWDLKALMEYVGWKDVKSAIRYIEATAPFASNLVSITPSGDHLTPMQEAAPWPTSTLELLLCIENYHAKVRGEKKARDHIERICLKRYAMRCLDRSLGRYRVAIEHESPAHLDRIINDILTEMQQIADSHQCFIEAWFEDRITGRRWD
jgi:hypothetical protein